MLDPIIVQTQSSTIRIRLQAPSLIVGKHMESVKVKQDGLGWEANSGPVSATVSVTQHQNDYYTIEGTITNHGSEKLEISFTYPALFYHFHNSEAARIFNPRFGGSLAVIKYALVETYPGPGSFCLTGATVPDSAIAMGVYNTEQRSMSIMHVPAVQDGSMRFYIKRVQIKAGETFGIPVSYFKIGGHWGDVFAPYRDWSIANFSRIHEAPRWFTEEGYTETRKAHCVVPFHPQYTDVGIWWFDNEERPRTLSELKQEVDEAVEEYGKRGLKPLFYQFGWWRTIGQMKGLYMLDSFSGDYTEENGLIRDIIHYIHEKGGRTYLYTNAISVGEETDFFQTHSALLIRNEGGQPVNNGGYPMYMLCPSAPGLLDYWERVLQYVLIELDADGIFLDQVNGGYPSQYCYDPGHHHEHPDTYGKDIVTMIQHIAQKAKEFKPDAVVLGELCHDVRSLYLDESHGRGYVSFDNPYIIQAAEKRDKEPIEYYAFLKYISPGIRSQTTTMEFVMDGSPGHHDQLIYKENRGIFDYGFVPCRTEYPCVIAYLYGNPAEAQAILAVRSSVALPDARVFLPDFFRPISAGSSIIMSMDQKCASVEVDAQPRFILLNRIY